MLERRRRLGEGRGDATEEAAPPLPDLRGSSPAAIETTSQDDGWASLGQVGNYLSKTHASFDPRNYGFTKLSALAGLRTTSRSSSWTAGPRGCA